MMTVEGGLKNPRQYQAHLRLLKVKPNQAHQDLEALHTLYPVQALQADF